MARLDPQIQDHLEWLGFVQPTGLVVSAPALVRAGAILDRRDRDGQRLLEACVEERPAGPDGDPLPVIVDFETFARTVLGWSFSPKGYAGAHAAQLPDELVVGLPDYGVTLRPDIAVRELEPASDAPAWQLLVRVLDPSAEFDRAVGGDKLEASEHGRMERLLREASVPAGLLCNGRALRLISAPRGESSGWLEFKVSDMVQTAGRPICAALRLLLGEPTLLARPRAERLAALLKSSREFQNEVSGKLAEQVLHALYELLRGFQAAHEASDGALLREPLAERPDEVYRSLLTVILRLVFLLYAEEREMLPADQTFLRYYSLAGLYERLREDDARNPDTMSQRYGAWAQLLALFRMVHDGARAGEQTMPARHGVLFDPDRYPFLEGRPGAGGRQIHERIEPPLIPDGTIHRVLEDLLVLGGERLSYRALDVEQIGSVYETMMGFRLKTTTGRSLAVRAKQRAGAPTVVDLDRLLAIEPAQRAKSLTDAADRDLPPKVAAAVTEATSIDALHSALASVVDLSATPDVLARDAIVLQPSDERRKSGSHYTPRALTEPIVRTALAPVLDGLRRDGKAPSPEAILDLKVCDPAMGSAAFLVEACRQLGDALVESWRIHGERPDIPADEDEVIHARRLVAQRCLFGLDRNEVAVDLAKMSLWLATMARDHPLTFLDHALRHGDALVGLSRHQIQALHWDDTKPPLPPVRIAGHMARVSELRAEIREAGDATSDFELTDKWDEAQAELGTVRLFGDLAVLAFFSADKTKAREATRDALAAAAIAGQTKTMLRFGEDVRERTPSLRPFHWEIEFPEVFERANPGFDAFVGNPPFMGGTLIGGRLGLAYHAYLIHVYSPATGLADLCAFFLRRSYSLLRRAGAFGLVATNTVAQGDTRVTGLEAIARDGSIYAAERRYQWPGDAAVVVSVVHALKGQSVSRPKLNGVQVERISAFLREGYVDSMPAMLSANRRTCYMGTKVWGAGFVFEHEPSNGSSSLDDMERLLSDDPRNSDVIFSYIGGQEFNSSPSQSASRFVIDFGERTVSEAQQWPELLSIVEARVRPVRASNKQRNYRENWWLHANRVLEAFDFLNKHDRLLALASVSRHISIAFVGSRTIVSDAMVVILLHENSDFAVLQSRIHELWARFIGSSMKDDLRYTTPCFDTFPRPTGCDHQSLTEIGAAYYDFRARAMKAKNQGLTKIYNRFHEPNERDPEIEQLRDLHSAMDRAVLDAYGWTDVPTNCEFLLDYDDDNDDESRRRRKPWRYRWPDEVRDEVLARLIALNAERAAEEQRSGAAAAGERDAVTRKTGRAARKPHGPAAEALF
jgi:hypothetical protein